MSDRIYYCTKEDNTCDKKDSCKRYVDLDDKKCHVTLYKVACTKENNYILYMKHEENKKESEEQ